MLNDIEGENKSTKEGLAMIKKVPRVVELFHE